MAKSLLHVSAASKMILAAIGPFEPDIKALQDPEGACKRLWRGAEGFPHPSLTATTTTTTATTRAHVVGFSAPGAVCH